MFCWISINPIYDLKIFCDLAEALPENPELKAQITEIVNKYAKGLKKGNQAFLNRYINRTFNILNSFFEKQTDPK